MSWTDCSIFCVYPQDSTTAFLDRIISYLSVSLKSKFHCFKVKLNDNSHDECLKIINIYENRIVIFLGHGKSDMLYGACGDEGDNVFLNNESEKDNTDYFNKKDFITIENASIFKNNIIFSLSCNSNVLRHSIGQAAIIEGAKAFIGFGNIPTDFEKDNELTKREIAIFKGILVKIIKKSLLYAISNNTTVEVLVDSIKIITNKEIFKLLAQVKGVRNKNKIAKHLYYFKKDIVIFGKKHIQLLPD